MAGLAHRAFHSGASSESPASSNGSSQNALVAVLERIDGRLARIEESLLQGGGDVNATPVTVNNDKPVVQILSRDQPGRKRNVIISCDADIIISPQQSVGAGGIAIGAADSPFDLGEIPAGAELYASRDAGVTATAHIIAFVATR